MDSDSPDWDALARTHGPMVFDTAWRLLGQAADSEDVVQEAFLDAFRLYGRQPVANWGGLLRLLATRRAIDRLRNRRPELPLTPEGLPGEPAGPPAEQPEAVVVARELADRLRDALAGLPEREATVFSLHYFAELGNAEIAELLGSSRDAVGVALHKARRRLKELLGLEPIGLRRARS